MSRTSNAKDQICEHAKRLFNEKGYKQVSLREIADAAGTTIGNLTYHFPQKENLIEAIQTELHASYADDFFLHADSDVSLATLYRSFLTSQKYRDNNPFYYRYVHELCADSKVVAQNSEQFRKKLFDYYIETFQSLKKTGQMRSDLTDEQYQTLVYIIIVVSTAWTQNASPYYDEALPKMTLAHALSDMICPYLTESGIEQWKKVANT